MSPPNSDKDRNYTETVSTRLSSQTKENFDRYKEENDLTNAQALRRIVRDELDPDTSAARRDFTDIIVAFFTGVFGGSMALTYGFRTVMAAIAVGLLFATIAAALKYGRYDIRLTIINRKNTPGDKSVGSGISFTSDPRHTEVAPTTATESDDA